MTYSVAWKTKSAAFIITDSAVTKSYQSGKNNQKTSFGEQQGLVCAGMYVYENAYKIFSEANVAYSLAGDSIFGTQLINDIASRIDVGFDIETAINSSIENYPDFSNKPAIELTIVFYNEVPKIITIKNKRKEFVKDEYGLVLNGSPNNDLLIYTNKFYDQFSDESFAVSSKDEDSEVFLIKMITLLQSYGIHNYTMENGIGGAYTGLFVSSSGIHYQPDICYLISGENPAFDAQKIATVNINYHSLCIINTDASDVVISSEVFTPSEEERLMLLEESRARFDIGKYKYFVFMNTFRHIACIVNMNFEYNHLLLSIDIREDKKGILGLIISTHLQFELNDNYDVPRSIQEAKINYIPYIPAPNKKIDSIKNEIRNLRVGKLVYNRTAKYKFITMESGVQTDWWYGNKDSIIPFLKYNKECEFIRIVDATSDMVVLEYESGDIIFPELGYHVDELFINIVNKDRKEDVYIFDFYPESGIDDFIFVHVLADNFEDALYKANVSVINEYGSEHSLLFSGKQFYHPKYFWNDLET